MTMYMLNTNRGQVQINLNDIRRTDGGTIIATDRNGHFTETDSTVTMRNGDVHSIDGREYGQLIGTMQRLSLIP